MSQVGSAFVVVKPLLTDFRSEVAQGVNRAVGSATIPLPVSPKIATGSAVTWERLASGATIPKVVPLPVQPTITPAAQSAFAGEAKGIRGLLIGAGQFGASRALGISGAAAGLFAFAIAATKAVKSAADLEQSLNVFQQTSGATADQMVRVREEARKLGADISLPAVSAGDAAQTMTELAKAGLSVDDVLKGTRGTLQLATAAQIDFASASELSANALNAFQLPGSDAVKVADLLSGAANAAQGNISDFGLGLSQVAAVAHQAGLSIQETVTFLTEFAKAGIAGSDAGTSFRVGLLRLIAPTTQAQKIFNELGVNLRGFQAGTLRAPQFFRQLQGALAPLDKATRNAALATIFGTDAIRTASIAVNDAGTTYNTLTGNVGRAGQAQEIANAHTKGLAGSVSGLASNLETLGTDLGTVVLPLLTALTNEASKGITAFDKLANKVIDTANRIAGVHLGPFGSIGQIVKDNVKNAVAAPFQPLHASIDLLRGDFKGAAVDLEHFIPGTVEAVRALNRLRGATSKPLAAPVIPNAVRAPGGSALNRLITGSLADPELEKAMAAAGRKAAAAFSRAAGTEITKQERTVIDAAKKTVRDAQAALKTVVAEGARAIEASAVEAKQSLTSIGQGLADQVGTLLDTGALAQRIGDLTTIQDRLTRSRDALQASLDRQQKALQRVNLSRDLKTAEDDLKRAQEQLVGGAPSTAESRAGNARFLQPFKDRVRDAKSALSDFDAQARVDKITERINTIGLKISGLGDKLDAQKTRIQRTLNDIVAKFNAGLLTGPQASARVAAILEKNVGAMSKAGDKQGFAFKQAFAAQVFALQAQIAAILGGPQTKKTGAEPTVVNPQDAVVAAARNTAAARSSVADAIKAVAKAQSDATKAVTNPDGTNAILRDIRRELKGKPSKPSAVILTPGVPGVKPGSGRK